MTLGAAALARPLALQDAVRMRVPFVLMNAALALVIVLALRKRQLGRLVGFGLLVSNTLYISYIFIGSH